MKIITASGYDVLVDDEDYERLSLHKWYVSYKLCHDYYCVFCKIEKRKVCMANAVLQVTPAILNGNEVDHLDRNGLNNQKYNLEIKTHKENLANSRRWEGHIPKGVCWDKSSKSYKVFDNKRHIGRRKTLEEAVVLFEEYKATKCE